MLTNRPTDTELQLAWCWGVQRKQGADRQLTVARNLSAVHRCMRSPMLTSTVPGMGWTSWCCPSFPRTCPGVGYAMLCDVMLLYHACYTDSPFCTLCHVISCPVMPRHVTLWYIMPRYAVTPCYVCHNT